MRTTRATAERHPSGPARSVVLAMGVGWVALAATAAGPVDDPPPRPTPAILSVSPTQARFQGRTISVTTPPPPQPAVAPVASSLPPPPPREELTLQRQGRPAGNAQAAAFDEPEAARSKAPRRARVVDDSGRTLVARVHGDPKARVVLLPDGQLGFPNGLVYTDEPFEPLSADALCKELEEGPYRGFSVHRTPHYLVFYRSSRAFAEASGQLLESLYKGLTRAFRERALPVHDSEFPLVAVIFRTEAEFREHKPVARDIQAYYEITSNRILFYESREPGLEPPDVSARRKPQTVAHEGTHQILQNIGIQPRLAPWPLWLVEGLAEFCAPTETRGGHWAGFNKINPFHMATLRDLEDSLALQGRDARLTRQRIGREGADSTVAYLVTRERLSPTDYAMAWALTHYLANRRFPQFVAYLNDLSRMAPLAPMSPDDHLRAFRAAFGNDLGAIDHHVNRHLSGFKSPELLVYYAVTFEQPIAPGRLKRGTLVSQSPQVIQQWLDEMDMKRGIPYTWEAWMFPSRAAAVEAAEQWINGR